MMKAKSLVSGFFLTLGSRSVLLNENEEYELTDAEFASIAPGYVQASEPVVEKPIKKGKVKTED
jgi:hypothetical protein